MRQTTVMVIEQERRTAVRLGRQLRELGYAVAGPLASVELALASVVEEPEIILVDLRLARGVGGRGGLRRLQERSGAALVFRAPRGHGCEIEPELAALAYGYLVMPCDVPDLQAALSIALARRTAEGRRETAEGRLRRLVDNVPVLLGCLDAGGRYQFANRLHEKWFGIACDRVPGRSPLEVLGPDWFASLQSVLPQVLAGQPASIEHAAGGPEDRHAQIHLVPDRSTDGVRGAFLAATNVGNRIEAERRLCEERDRLEAALDALDESVIAFDGTGRARHLNRSARALTGWAGVDRGIPLPADDALRFIEPATGWHLENPAREALTSGQPAHLPPGALLLSPDGREYAVQGHSSPLRNADGAIVGAVLVLRSASPRDGTTGPASHDPLTGLLNRAQFGRALDARMRSARLTGQHQALLHIDVDQLREINEAYGHHAGDALLRRLAELLRAKLRSADLLARLGPDEFAVLVESCPPHRARHMGQVVLDALREAGFAWQGRSVGFSLSVGVATVDSAYVDADAGLAAAELACILAKEAGGGCVSGCPPEPVSRGGERGTLKDAAARVAQALADDRLHLFAQRVAPVDDAAAGGDWGYEILVRLEGHTGAILPPTAFLPSDERDAAMAQLDRWVIARTLRTLAAAHTPEDACGRYAINLSAASVADEGLPAFIAAQLDQSGVAPDRICFEVAEPTALADMQRTIALAQRLNAIGCGFALDHFSSGVSAREYLQHLPVSYIKIDGSFVKGMLDDRLDCAVVEGIHRIGQALGIGTVAEHAESAAILAKLREMGVTQAQGFAIHRPEPLDRALESRAERLALLDAAGDLGRWSAEWQLQ
jgi:diguanylate cyclase (GGDEF)-like protein/PAS domain S-box-containing protein